MGNSTKQIRLMSQEPHRSTQAAKYLVSLTGRIGAVSIHCTIAQLSQTKDMTQKFIIFRIKRIQ